MTTKTTGNASASSVAAEHDGGNPTTVSREQRRLKTAALFTSAESAGSGRRTEILNEIVELNLPVARALARRYRNRGQAQDDLDQVACLALTKAVRRFDPDRSDDLLLFATPCILGELKRHFRNYAWSIRPPRGLQEIRMGLARVEQELVQRLGRAPSDHEVAEALGVRTEEVIEARRCSSISNTLSLDDPVRVGTTFADLVPHLEDGFDHVEVVDALARACTSLSDRDRGILFMRFYEDRTQSEIALHLGVSQVQVSRLLQRIFGVLRAAVTGDREHAA